MSKSSTSLQLASHIIPETEYTLLDLPSIDGEALRGPVTAGLSAHSLGSSQMGYALLEQGFSAWTALR